MNLSVIRAFTATVATCTIATIGCAAPVPVDGDANPEAAGDQASPGEEGNLGQTQQAVAQQHALFPCPNDIPATGFINFPYNDANEGANSGWHSGCAAMRVYRNTSYPQNFKSIATALADFPQFEGTWSATKEAQCRASYVDMRVAQKTSPSHTYEDDHYIYGWYWYAEPTIEYLYGQKYRITNCRASYYMGVRYNGQGGSWYPDMNYMRVDARAVVNNSVNNPVGAAKAYVKFEHNSSL